MAKIIPTEENSIFALDIGTRTVIGIVALVESSSLRIVAQHMIEHSSRAMFDGQIHDIPKVADTVLQVKRVLEKKLGFKLTKAAIAAAGRSLVTKQCHVEMEINESVEIESILVNSLEITGIRNAHQEVDADVAGNGENFYCVGYSVIKYYLNNYPVTNLTGHRGKIIGADVLATFLPESVVNGLYAVLGRVGLEPLNMTLEPIAAIEVLIPENMRLLNLALIDIGAGTSDIAITRKGSVVSYGMVPMAGDEITEAVAEALLVDFNWAEKIKRSLDNDGDIVYKDILGIENTVTAAEVSGMIEPVLDKLSAELAGSIINLNGGESPKTVFCVGGGSRLPLLTNKLAEQLGLETQKVAARGRSALQNVTVDEEGLEGPEGVTVVGIATIAIKKLGQNFVTIKVDGKEFSLFYSKDLNVANALSLLDFNPRDLIGRNGKDLKFTLNGTPKVVYGGLASPAEIYINGVKANLQSTINDGDEISILKAGEGAEAKAYVRDYLDGPERLNITLNGESRIIEPVCVLNGELSTCTSQIMPDSHLDIKTVKTIGDLFPANYLAEQTIQVNGATVSGEYVLRDGDEVNISDRDIEMDTAMDAVYGENGHSPGKVLSVTINGTKVSLTGKEQYIFVDVLNHIEIDLNACTNLPVLQLNGAAAGFTDVLADGDVVEIRV